MKVLLTSLALTTLLMSTAAMSTPPMDADRFWAIIKAGKAKGSDRESGERLATELQKLSLEDLVAFDQRFELYRLQADTYDLWAAGSLLNGLTLSDDGSQDYTAWLVSRGREAFEEALANPDSLADVSQEQVDLYGVTFQQYSYAPMDAFEANFEGNYYDHIVDIDRPDRDDEPGGILDDGYVKQKLPRLHSMYGPVDRSLMDVPSYTDAEIQEMIERFAELNEVFFNNGDYEFTIRNQTKLLVADVPYLGVVKDGAVVVHTDFGEGRIQGMREGLYFGDKSMAPLALVAFDDGVRVMVLRGSVFSLKASE